MLGSNLQRISIHRWVGDPPEPGDVLRLQPSGRLKLIDQVRVGRVHPYVLIVVPVEREQLPDDARVCDSWAMPRQHA